MPSAVKRQNLRRLKSGREPRSFSLPLRLSFDLLPLLPLNAMIVPLLEFELRHVQHDACAEAAAARQEAAHADPLAGLHGVHALRRLSYRHRVDLEVELPRDRKSTRLNS